MVGAEGFRSILLSICFIQIPVKGLGLFEKNKMFHCYLIFLRDTTLLPFITWRKIIVEVICSPNMKRYWNFQTLFKNNCPGPLSCFEHFWCICRQSRLCPRLCQETEVSKWAGSERIGQTLSTVSEKVLNKVIPKGQNHQNSVLPPSTWCREYRHFLLLWRIQAGCTQSGYNSRWQLLEWPPVILKMPLT